MVLLLACGLVTFVHAQEGPDTPILRIGILAHRGWDAGESQWTSLERYLARQLPGHVVRFVPVTLTSAGPLINAGGLDFLVTNPGHYIQLADLYPLSVLATRKRALPDGSHIRQFGSTVLVRADSGLATLGDLRGTRLGAVAQQAFGGFQIAWFEARAQGVDLFDDPAELVFLGFPQDDIATAVLNGRLDAGIVRSGLLEHLVDEGRVPDGALRALNANVTYTHPEAISTRLYPEWPFLALSGTDPGLRDAVALALLQTGNSDLADQWGAPVSYTEARALVAAFAARRPEAASPARNPLGIAALALAAIALVGALLFFALRARRPAPTPPTPQADDVPLTRREQQVLTQIGEGQSTKEIAATLGISPKTVEFHRANLLRKFEVRSSAQLIARAGRHISPPETET
ncbi:PhnD/SsuA/transferrin family substrate-binding protein [uncultured Mameliella sp.]|uniref:PhnD/SsuA/transferrin family substrate-binding protein n=1 Tax=uncultured Mameliella sp. TaxID=1447087 RepID=UPI00261D578D|nr:PhnD/SsuA/transferrin family substrate-binding protein [uncultured Mameliella sp.]